MEELKVVLPIWSEGIDIADVHFRIINIAEYVFHGFLREVGQALEAHG
jgi:hypothetical protein